MEAPGSMGGLREYLIIDVVGSVACGKAGAVMPAFSRPWVPWQFIDLSGAFVDLSDKCHPCRAARVQYGWFDGAPED